MSAYVKFMVFGAGRGVRRELLRCIIEGLRTPA